MEPLLEKECPNQNDDGHVCGNLLTLNVKFCPECGWKIPKTFWQIVTGNY